MTRHSLAAILLGLLVIGTPLRAETPQDDLGVTLTCKVPSFRTKAPPVMFSGNCGLSDGIYIRVMLQRIVETLTAKQLQASVDDVGKDTATIEDKKFSYSVTIPGPGKYLASASIPIDLQERDYVAELQKKIKGKPAWQFEFLLWGDDLVPVLSSKLVELNALVAEIRQYIAHLEASTASEREWASAKTSLVPEGDKLVTKVKNSDLRAFYPATVNELFYITRIVSNTAKYFTFNDGKFAGAKDYHADNKQVKTHRNEDFTWENFKRYVEECAACAGREFSLWIVKDLHRTAGQMRPEILDAVKTHKADAGVDLYVERLTKATISDLDGLEADIRGLNLGKK